jgi:1,4-alpha-glucan branching enzyme
MMHEVLSLHDPRQASVIAAIANGRLGNPFAVLGPHRINQQTELRTFHPGATAVSVRGEKTTVTLQQIGHSGVFVGMIDDVLGTDSKYTLQVSWPVDGGETVQVTEDPYAFGLLLGELDLHLLAEGRHHELGRCLGALPLSVDGVEGTRFAVWAPNASRVSVVGDFNAWDGRRHPMRLREQAGVWEIFIPRIGAGTHYKYELLDSHGNVLPLKADPVARASELPPATGSIVASNTPFRWTDDAWIKTRNELSTYSAPMSIYEVHAGSWLRIVEEGNRNLDWNELAERLIPYAVDMGFTHLEFLPIMEHPFGGSWGYQALSAVRSERALRLTEPPSPISSIKCHHAGTGRDPRLGTGALPLRRTRPGAFRRHVAV